MKKPLPLRYSHSLARRRDWRKMRHRLCRNSRSTRSGRSRCRTIGFSARSPASRPTDSIASGSCTARARSPRASVPPSRTRPRRSAASPRRRCWCSTSPAISSAPGAVRARATNGRKASTAFSSTTTTSSGSPATARRTASCSSSPWTASSCCRSASRARATTAIRPSGSARRPTSRSMLRRTRCSAADGYANRRVVVFDTETGAYKRHWGAYGNKPSDDKTPPYDPAKPAAQQFGNPVHCIRIAKDGLVYVCDRTNNRVQIFRKDGTLRVRARLREGDARHRLGLRSRVLARQGAEIHLHDRRHERRSAHHRPRHQGDARRFGRPGRQAGMFTALHNIAVDHQGNIYTAEVNTGQRVQRFRRLDAQD